MSFAVYSMIYLPSTLRATKGCTPTVRLSIKLLSLAGLAVPGSPKCQGLSHFQLQTEAVFAFQLLVSVVGFEPTTLRVLCECSTFELYTIDSTPRRATSVATYPFGVHNTTRLMSFSCRILDHTSGYFGYFNPFSVVLPLALTCRFELL